MAKEPENSNTRDTAMLSDCDDHKEQACPENILSLESADERAAFESILRLLLDSNDIDFTHYRQPTVLRRISRRITLNNFSSFRQYAAYISENELEIERLCNDLLLSHTEFFRDNSVFEMLKRDVFPSLVEARSAKDPIRIWVAGCSSGEEVFSIAITLDEYLSEMKSCISIQIFATDLNIKNITAARHAIYPDKSVRNIDPARLEHYFDRTADGWQVIKRIREKCIFAVQDLSQDPPFPSIDLISCRNVLIYFDSYFQDIVIPMFHFSLKAKGFLLLGTSESMGMFSNLFHTVNRSANLYIKIPSAHLPEYTIKRARQSLREQQVTERNGITSVQQNESTRKNLDTTVDTTLLQQFAPPSIVVDSTMQIRKFRGDISPFISPLSGDASLKMSRMTSQGIVPDIYVAIEEAKRVKGNVIKHGVYASLGGNATEIDIGVFPIADESTGETCFLITFSNTREPVSIDALAMSKDEESESGRLRAELQNVRTHLQSLIEEKDKANQELWAANEEVQSTNEELQSVNEEMEAAKEELEASNEELRALNDELRTKSLDLQRAHDFTKNIIETAYACIVILDNEATIQAFNHFAEQLTGYKREEVVGKSWFDIFIPNSEKAAFKLQFANTLNSIQETKPHENTIIIKDGSLRTISWTNSLLWNVSGSCSGVLYIGLDVTEQRAIEREKFRLFDIIEKSLNEIYVFNAVTLKFEYLNVGALQNTGFTIEEMGQLTPIDIEPYVTDAEFRQMIYPLISGEKDKLVYETVHRRKNSSEYPVEVHLQIYNYGDESVFFAAVNDITERKTAELNLSREREEYQTILDAAPVMVVYKGKDDRIVRINTAFAEFHGLTGDEIIGFSTYDIIPDRSMAEQERLLDLKVLQNEKPIMNQVQQYTGCKKGKTIWTLYSKLPYFKPDGSIDGTITYILDIDARIRAEEALKEREYFFRESQRAALIGSYKTDLAKGIWESSEVLDRIFGIGTTHSRSIEGWLDIVHPDDRQMMQMYLQEEVIAKRKKFDMEYRIVRKSDNETRWVYGRGELGFNAQGAATSMIGTIQDITDRKITELTLQKTQRLESLGILAGGIAHDFNNLLGGIFGYIDASLNDCQDNGIKKNLEKAIATMERARALTSQLLTFAKGGAPTKKQQSFSPFIEETVRFALSGTNARPEFSIQENLWTSEFDRSQIGQVLDNLIINAQQAMPHGGTIFVNAENCTICTSTHPQLESGHYVKISVHDQGTGIPKEIMNKIFDPFFTTKAKGHGLGLSTSYSIVKRHGGIIEVASETGKGSVFSVYLPALTTAASIDKDCQEAKKSASGLILVMDDEEVIRDTIELMLTTLGYEVCCVTNANAALMEFKRTTFAAIILDLTIPGGTGGLDVVREIRKFNTTVPVFVSSGYADNPVMASPEEYGFNGSICKPFKKSELACMLEKGMKI